LTWRGTSFNCEASEPERQRGFLTKFLAGARARKSKRLPPATVFPAAPPAALEAEVAAAEAAARAGAAPTAAEVRTAATPATAHRAEAEIATAELAGVVPRTVPMLRAEPATELVMLRAVASTASTTAHAPVLRTEPAAAAERLPTTATALRRSGEVTATAHATLRTATPWTTAGESRRSAATWSTSGEALRTTTTALRRACKPARAEITAASAVGLTTRIPPVVATAI
jgi:hypothetical protein